MLASHSGNQRRLEKSFLFLSGKKRGNVQKVPEIRENSVTVGPRITVVQSGMFCLMCKQHIQRQKRFHRRNRFKIEKNKKRPGILKFIRWNCGIFISKSMLVTNFTAEHILQQLVLNTNAQCSINTIHMYAVYRILFYIQTIQLSRIIILLLRKSALQISHDLTCASV